jgi:hypothetical protein
LASGVFVWHVRVHPVRTERAIEPAEEQALREGSRAQSAHVASGVELFPRGLEQSYEMHETTSVSTATGQPVAGLVLQGQLRLIGLQAGPTTRVRGEFEGTVQVLVGGEPDDSDPSVAPSARKPFMLEFESDGRFKSALGAQGTPQIVARTWTALGESLQLIRAGDATHWERLEKDAIGEYTASYERSSTMHVTKHKLGYQNLTQDIFEAYELLRSDEDFELDSHARPPTPVKARRFRACAPRRAFNCSVQVCAASTTSTRYSPSPDKRIRSSTWSR